MNKPNVELPSRLYAGVITKPSSAITQREVESAYILYGGVIEQRLTDAPVLIVQFPHEVVRGITASMRVFAGVVLSMLHNYGFNWAHVPLIDIADAMDALGVVAWAKHKTALSGLTLKQHLGNTAVAAYAFASALRQVIPTNEPRKANMAVSRVAVNAALPGAVARLNAYMDGRDGIPPKPLITPESIEAVCNMVHQAVVNGLPVLDDFDQREKLGGVNPTEVMAAQPQQSEAKSDVKNAVDYLTDAKLTMEARGKEYDSPQGERSFDKIANAYNAIKGYQAMKGSDVALLLAILKMVRDQNGKPHADSLQDFVAYSALYAEMRNSEGK